MKSEERDPLNKMTLLLKYIEQNNISLAIGNEKEADSTLSLSTFTKMMQDILGEEYIFVLHDDQSSISIIDTIEHDCIGTIYGTLTYGYIRGDFWGSPLTFQYAISKLHAFVKDTEAGYLDSANSITFLGGELYIIDKKTHTLKKYVNKKLAWVAQIPVNITQTYQCYPLWNYPDATYPGNLIAISDGYEIFHFNKNTGEYYGKSIVKRTFIKVNQFFSLHKLRFIQRIEKLLLKYILKQ